MVFLAGTNTGKSTLITELIHQGYRYISDDYVILSKDNTGIIPFHLPLKLRTLEFTTTVEEKQIVVRDFNLMTSALSLARVIEVYKIYFTRTENCINYIKKAIGENQDV